MGLFPQSFIEDVRQQADIVQVVQEYVSLKRTGAAYKGLCPFHAEKTPSFTVNRDKGLFHCFGCGAGGDVFKFLEQQENLGFQDAVRHLAEKFGLALPEMESRGDSAPGEREALLEIHERAALYFQAQLASDAGAQARQHLKEREITDETREHLGLGFAPRTRDGLERTLAKEGFDRRLLLRAGLVVEREGGPVADRFRNRLTVPICRDTGPVVAFGARALEAGQQPKYLNSPETAIYSKSRMLYGLHLAKPHIRRLGYVILVEGYFDFAQLWQAGIRPVVASCGTALTARQAQLLRRFTPKVILSFDPDAAGQGAAVRSCDLLVTEGFDVNVAILPAGEDPDGFVRAHGREAYHELLRTSRPYLDYVMEQAAAQVDLGSDEGRRQFLAAMMPVAAGIPDPASRDQFADRVAHRSQITEEVIRTEIRKAAAARRTQLTPREIPHFGELRAPEKGLLWALVHEPETGLQALAEIDTIDFEGLLSARILQVARSLGTDRAAAFPATLFEQLSPEEAQALSGAASAPSPPAPARECALALRRRRFEREQAQVQQEIDRLQRLGAEAHGQEINELWERRMTLVHQIEGLA